MKDYISAANVDRWTVAYDLKSKVRCAPGNTIVQKVKTAEVSHLQRLISLRC